MHIIARVDANEHVGIGHAVRVRAIVDTLDIHAQLMIVGRGDELIPIFPNAEIHKPTETPSIQIAATATKIGTKLILCDHPDLEPDLRDDLEKHTNVPVIIIDDFGGNHRASGIINGTVLPNYHQYPNLHDDALRMCGGNYALLRPSFGRTSRPVAHSRTIGIVVGTGKRAAAWVDFLVSGAIDFSQLGSVGIVVGWTYPEPDMLKAKCVAHGISFAKGLSEEDLVEFLASSQVALVTGGMIVYESLAVGTPTIIFPNLKNLVAEAEWFSAHDCAINLGKDGGFDAPYLRHVIASILTDSDTRERMAKAGREVIDGHGVARVCKRLNERYNLTESDTL